MEPEAEDFPDVVSNTMHGEHGHNEGERQRGQQIQEVIDLTENASAGFVPLPVSNLHDETAVWKKKNSCGYERNSCETRQHINSVKADPSGASAAIAAELLLRERKFYPDLKTAISQFQRHSELLGCAHVRVRDGVSTLGIH